MNGNSNHSKPLMLLIWSTIIFLRMGWSQISRARGNAVRDLRVFFSVFAIYITMKKKTTKQPSLLEYGITKTSRSSEPSEGAGTDSTEFSSKTIYSESTRGPRTHKRTVLKWKKEYPWLMFDVEKEDETIAATIWSEYCPKRADVTRHTMASVSKIYSTECFVSGTSNVKQINVERQDGTEPHKRAKGICLFIVSYVALFLVD